MTHLCPTRRCPREVPDHLLMCGIHWRQVPRSMQRAVLTAYDHGRGLYPNGVPMPALASAQLAAIRAVNSLVEDET
jgi:hypothetical protein